MVTTPPLRCPQCGTDDYLYTQPSKHFTYVECDKALGGCGFQSTLPNDNSGSKVKDNLMAQEFDEPLDSFYAGYFGMMEVGEQFKWTLVSIVSELKKAELETHLKEKVEMFSKLKEVKEVKYMIKEYTSTGGATSTFVSESVKKEEKGCGGNCGCGHKEPETDKEGTIKNIMDLRHKVQSQSSEEISEELLREHGQITKVTCGMCGSKNLFIHNDDGEFELCSDEVEGWFAKAKKSKKKFEWEHIDCNGCEGQTNALDVVFIDGTKVEVGWEDYPKLFGVKQMKIYMDDLFGALAEAQKNGTKIIGMDNGGSMTIGI